MPNQGLPSDPNPSPAMATGLYSDPSNRGKPLEDIIASLPHYSSWEDAIARVPGSSDEEKTQYLRSVYGLGQSFKVQGGRLVSDDHSTRNGILAGLAVLGGPTAIQGLGGLGAAAAPEIGLSESTIPGGAAVGIGSTAATGTVAGGSAAGGGSILGSVIPHSTSDLLTTAKNLSPILGGAAKSSQDNAMNQAILANADRNYRLTAPATRLRTAQKASLTANAQPSSAEWGGPGSGLAGQQVKFSGASSNPDAYNADTKQLANNITHQELTSQLSGEDQKPITADTGIGGKVLGGGALLTSLLGALLKPQQAPAPRV